MHGASHRCNHSLVCGRIRVHALTHFPPRSDNSFMKAFIISDDFAETNFFKTLLAKIGMQVESAKNPRAIAETIMDFNPNMVLVTGRSKQFDGVQTAIDIKKKYSRAKVILIKNANTPIDDKVMALDGFLDSPVGVAKLVGLVADLFNKDIEKLSAKLNINLDKSTSGGDSQMVSGGQGDGSERVHVTGDVSSESDVSVEGSKIEKYKKLAKQFEPIDTTKAFDRDRIHEFNKKLREQEDPEEQESVNEEKKAFVVGLFSED